MILLIAFAQTTLGQDFQISETGDAHFGPAIGVDSAGNCIVVWSDARNSIENGGPDIGTAIYAQRFSHSRMPIGDNFRVSETELGGGHWSPNVSMNTKGEFVVTWEGWSGRIPGDIDIYARSYSNEGVPQGPSHRVSDDMGTTAQIYAKVFVQPNASFVITWLDRREGPLFSYAQLYDSTGSPRGANFKVNSNSVEGLASLGGFEDGRFFFMWAGYFQLYGIDGTPHSSIVNTGIDGLAYGLGADTLLIIWRPLPLLNTIFSRLLSTNGAFLSDSLRIDDDSLFQPKSSIAIAHSRMKGTVIVWQDHRNDPPGIIADGDIYAQRYDGSLSPIGNNFKVNHEPGERPQREPAVVFAGDSFVTVWTENQSPEPCLPPGVYLPPDTVNIRAMVQSFDNPTPGKVFGWRTKRDPCPPPPQFALYQNYPNPFNLETTIPFDVPEDGFVDISVYDILGGLVQRVVHDPFVAGRYEATFNGAGLSSGIYFYRLSTEQITYTQRMILIK